MIVLNIQNQYVSDIHELQLLLYIGVATIMNSSCAFIIDCLLKSRAISNTTYVHICLFKLQKLNSYKVSGYRTKCTTSLDALSMNGLGHVSIKI